jgi:hypothetical protein
MVSTLKYGSLAAAAIVTLLSPMVQAQGMPTTMDTSVSATTSTGGAYPSSSPDGSPVPDIPMSSSGGSGSEATSTPAGASGTDDPYGNDTPSPTGFTPTATGGVASPTGGIPAGALTGPCTQEGLWNCLGSIAFQRCASGQWSPVQSMAAGTTCQPGQSQSLWPAGRRVRRQRLQNSGRR